MAEAREVTTTLLPVDGRKIGSVTALLGGDDTLDQIDIQLDSDSTEAESLRFAAKQLRESDIPVAFPTETVYGLGADATRSAAVQGIYKAKRRPADNPLIVHVASLEQLRGLLRSEDLSGQSFTNGGATNRHSTNGVKDDPIPAIYKPLLSKFWPGPLTIILPTPPNSQLAPEVTAGLDTFGVRMPRHILALALIKLADRPIAAPSANASTKPSPTAAEHVLHDLRGRIETIVDGGPCDVGVESTVVDGLSKPPLILRPGGISLEQLRSCTGWEDTMIGYMDSSQAAESKPKAPGMKYRHYSPNATVVLYEIGNIPGAFDDILQYIGPRKKLGVITTGLWEVNGSLPSPVIRMERISSPSPSPSLFSEKSGFAGMLESLQNAPDPKASMTSHELTYQHDTFELLHVALGSDTTNIARGMFAALRELDHEDVDAILVEGIDENDGHVAAAVMNRLRKASEVNIGGRSHQPS